MIAARLLSVLLVASLAVPAAGCASLLRRGADEAAAAKVQLPTPVRVELPNGLTLLVLRRSNLPIVSVSTVVRAGSAHAPAGKGGLADLTAAMLRRGTATRTAPQIASAIDFVGGSLETGAGLESSQAELSVLKKDLDLGLTLLADVLQRPSFPQVELDRLKEEREAALTAALDDANEVVRMAFTRSLLGGHPYGRQATVTSLKGLQRSDLTRFYETYYRPNNTFMAVVGDITPDEARERFTKAFGGWKARPVPQVAIAAPKAVERPQVVLVDMPVNQSFIRLGHMGVARNTPDYFPLMVMNFILGGGFTSRLNQSIRDRQGLAYGASSGLGMNLFGGTFHTGVETKSESTVKALQSLLAEIRTIQDQPVSPSELAFAQDYLTGSFPLRFETNDDLAREVLNIEFFGLPADYLSTYQARVRAVTAEEIQQVARKYLHPDRYQLVVVAKAQAVEPQLGQFGPLRKVEKGSLIQ